MNHILSEAHWLYNRTENDLAVFGRLFWLKKLQWAHSILKSMKTNLDLSCFCWFQLVFLWFTSHFLWVLSNYCCAKAVLNATYVFCPHKCIRCVALPMKNDGGNVSQTFWTDMMPCPCGWIRMADILCCVHILLIANFELWTVNLWKV